MGTQRVWLTTLLVSALLASPAHAGPDWVIDGTSDDENSILGEVKDILRLDDGRTVLLDVQQGLVKVFDRNGRHQITTSYEGDGPGEVRNPVALVAFPPNRVSIVQARPPKLAMLGLNGAEPSDCSLLMREEQGYVSVFDAASNGRSLVLKLYVESREGGATVEVLKLVRWHTVDSEPIQIAERKETMESRGGMLQEFDSLDELSLWDMDNSGRIVIAPYFESFEVQVWSPDGSLHRVDRISDYARVRKSVARYESIRGHYERMSKFIPDCRGVDVSEYERDIQELAAANDGGYLVIGSDSAFPEDPVTPLRFMRWTEGGVRLPDLATDILLRRTCDMIWISGDYAYVLRGGKSALLAARRGDAVGDAIAGKDPCAVPDGVADMTLECYSLFDAP